MPGFQDPSSDQDVRLRLVNRLRIEEFRDKASPSGLVERAAAPTCVAVEVLVEGQKVSKTRIVVELLDISEDRSLPVSITQEEAGETATQF